MRVLTARSAVLGLVALFGIYAQAQEGFEPWIVDEFRVEGSQYIEDGTVYNYLPINIGDTIDLQRVQEAMRALYATEFFQDIELRREDDTLVIVVLERPRIESFTFEGNQDFKDEDLEQMLIETDMVVGKIFDRSMLDEIARFLTEEYYGQGKYAATIESSVEEVPGNRVRVHIEIEEGDRARIREINIVGNTVFDDDEILGIFELRTGGMLSRFRKNDRYSKQALEGDLEALRSLYMDRGYADFTVPVDGVQVSISPDKTDIFISINLQEGEVYTVSSVDIGSAGRLPIEDDVLKANLFVRPGMGYSLEAVTYSEDAIRQILGLQGYAFAEVQTLPELDRETNEVGLTFFVEPQKRVYVRRITFLGAEGSRDEVFRREVRQLEGGILSNLLLDRSEQRIRLLPYVEEVSYETVPVLGSDDLVDVEFTIEEGLPGSMGGSIGYSESQGIVLGGDFVHSNFLGTGDRVQVNLSGGEYYKVYGFNYTQPYRNQNGLSRQISLRYQDITRYSSVTSDFSTTSITAGMTWGMPITEVQTYRVGFRYRDSELLISRYSSDQSRQWVIENGESFELFPGSSSIGTKIQSIDFVTGWSLERRNRTLFPDQGMRASLDLQASIPGSDVEYYVARLNVEKFFPVSRSLRFRINSEFAFGDAYGDTTTALPPFESFFGGGPGSIRGFKENYLGPRDSYGNPSGGNMSIINQFELILPTPGKLGNAARVSLFYDIGGIFHTGGIDFYDKLGDRLDTDFSSDKLKRSYGLGVQWLSPMGLLQFSYAVPVNKDQATDRFFADQTEGFQFTIGQAF